MENEEEKVLDGENATEETVADDVEEASPAVEEDSTLDEEVADEAPADSEEGVA